MWGGEKRIRGKKKKDRRGKSTACRGKKTVMAKETEEGEDINNESRFRRGGEALLPKGKGGQLHSQKRGGALNSRKPESVAGKKNPGGFPRGRSREFYETRKSEKRKGKGHSLKECPCGGVRHRSSSWEENGTTTRKPTRT